MRDITTPVESRGRMAGGSRKAKVPTRLERSGGRVDFVLCDTAFCAVFLWFSKCGGAARPDSELFVEFFDHRVEAGPKKRFELATHHGAVR